MKKTLLSLFLSLTIPSLHAESLEPIISQQVKQMLPYSYQHRANAFQSKNIETNNEKYTLPWAADDKPNAERANIILNAVAEKPMLIVKRNLTSGNNLYLSKRFKVYSSFTYAGKIQANITKPNLPAFKKKLIPATLTLELVKNDKRRDLFAKFELISEMTSKEGAIPLKGSVEFNLIAEAGYDHTSISRDDTNKVFTLDGIKHEVIDIFDNTVVIKVEENKKKLDYKLINLDENKHLISPTSLEDKLEYDKHKKQFFYKKEYDLFKSNLSLSEEEYSSKLENDFKAASMEVQEKSGSSELFFNTPFTEMSKDIFNKHLGERYLVIKFLTPLKNNFLYVSKKIEKKITVNYGE